MARDTGNQTATHKIPERAKKMTLTPEKANDGLSRLTVAFESERLSYSDLEVDLYNSGVNQLISVAAARGHRIHHFSMADLYEHEGVPYVITSLLELPPAWSGAELGCYRHLRKVSEPAVRIADVHLCFARGDDIRTGETPNIDLLSFFEVHGTLIESVDATLASCDKFELPKRCPAVPQPLTFAASTMEEVRAAISQLPTSSQWFVLKDRFGYGCGEHVHRMSFEEPGLENRIEEFLYIYGSLILQEFRPEVTGGDLTVTFFGEELIGTLRRRAAQGQWKTNASLGAAEEPHELTPAQAETAWKVRRAFPEIRLASVDLLPSGQALEINAFPGGNGLYKAYGIELGKRVFTQLEQETRQRLEKNQEIALPPAPVGVGEEAALAVAAGKSEPLYSPWKKPVRVYDIFSGELHALDIRQVIDFTAKSDGYILSVPHAGMFVPEEYVKNFELDEKALLEIDLFSDILFEGLKGFQMVSRLAPFFVDMNRSRQEGEKDKNIPAHLSNPPHKYYTIENRLLLKKSYSPREEAAVLEYYELYHNLTETLIDHMKSERGYALIIDCHSMTSVGLGRAGDEGRSRDNFVVGTLGGTSADLEIIDAFVRTLRRESKPYGLDLSVTRDRPYAGGFITRRHSDPDQHVHVIQIEVTMDTYIYKATHQNAVQRYALKPHRVRVVQSILERAVNSARQAAERIYHPHPG